MDTKELKRLSEELGCSIKTLRKHAHIGDLDKYVQDRRWRMKHDVPALDRIYRRGSRKEAAVTVMRKAHITKGAAIKRLRRWVKGEITYEQLMKPHRAKPELKIAEGTINRKGIVEKSAKEMVNLEQRIDEMVEELQKIKEQYRRARKLWITAFMELARKEVESDS